VKICIVVSVQPILTFQSQLRDPKNKLTFLSLSFHSFCELLHFEESNMYLPVTACFLHPPPWSLYGLPTAYFPSLAAHMEPECLTQLKAYSFLSWQALTTVLQSCPQLPAQRSSVDHNISARLSFASEARSNQAREPH